MLDRQVRDAAPSVQDVGIDEGPRGAGVQTARAAAAAVRQGGIGLELRRGQHHADEEEGAEVRVEQHRVLPDPAQAGPGGEIPLEERTGVHVGPRHRPRRQLDDRVGKRPEPGLDDGVVVLAPGVPRHPGWTFLRRSLKVSEGAGDHRPRARQDPPGIDPLVPTPLEVGHGSGVARVEPALEGRRVIRRVRRPDRDEVEAEPAPGFLDARRKRRRCHGAVRPHRAGRARPAGSG